MKLNIQLDLETLWLDDGTAMAEEIRNQIRHTIHEAVKKEVRDTVKTVISEHQKDIKLAAKKCSTQAIKDMLK